MLGWGIWICGSITPATGRVNRVQRRTRGPHFVGMCCLAIVLNKETYWLRYVKMLLQRPSEESRNQSYTCPERWCPGALCNFRKSQATTHVEVVKWLAHRCSEKKTHFERTGKHESFCHPEFRDVAIIGELSWHQFNMDIWITNVDELFNNTPIDKLINSSSHEKGYPQVIQVINPLLVWKPMATTGDPPWLRKPCHYILKHSFCSISCKGIQPTFLVASQRPSWQFNFHWSWLAMFQALFSPKKL